jgi:hypothetical protein
MARANAKFTFLEKIESNFSAISSYFYIQVLTWLIGAVAQEFADCMPFSLLICKFEEVSASA